MPQPLDYARVQRPHPRTGPHQPAYGFVGVPAFLVMVAFILAFIYRATSSDAIIGVAVVVAVLGVPVVGLLAIFTIIDVVAACFSPVDRGRAIIHSLVVFALVVGSLPLGWLAYRLAVAR